MEPTRPIVLGIHIKVKDVNRSREFYESLGFKILFAFGDTQFIQTFSPSVRTVHSPQNGIMFEIGESALLEIADNHPAVRHEVFSEIITSPKVSAMVRVPTLLPLFHNPHIQISYPVRSYYWGTIEVVFRDPDGFVLVFLTDHSEEEINRLKEFVSIEYVSRPTLVD